jgi:hypothetical protein
MGCGQGESDFGSSTNAVTGKDRAIMSLSKISND